MITKSYNLALNTIDTQHECHITPNPCYVLVFEEWICENDEAITEFIVEYLEEFKDLTRAKAQIKPFNEWSWTIRYIQ